MTGRRDLDASRRAELAWVDRSWAQAHADAVGTARCMVASRQGGEQARGGTRVRAVYDASLRQSGSGTYIMSRVARNAKLIKRFSLVTECMVGCRWLE